MKTVLTIAGSDCSGGAGIQADIKTITAYGLYAMSVITAVTAQNTMGVHGVVPITADFVGEQLDCIFEDIFPDAIKIGMLVDSKTIQVTAERLRRYKAKHIILDPLMISTSGYPLLTTEAIQTMTAELFPLSELITPNILEAEVLCGISIKTKQDMEIAAEILLTKTEGSILLKGGHMDTAADDLLNGEGSRTWFCSERINSNNTHGTGCTLSSAIAAGRAEGKDLLESVRLAKEYVSGAISSGIQLGGGNGPINHCYCI